MTTFLETATPHFGIILKQKKLLLALSIVNFPFKLHCLFYLTIAKYEKM